MEDIEHGVVLVGTIECADTTLVVGVDVVDELLAISLNRKRWRILHMRQKYVEDITYLINELIKILLEIAVVRRDHGEPIVIDKCESGEMYGAYPIEREDNGVLVIR
jgi:hypothetical protein